MRAGEFRSILNQYTIQVQDFCLETLVSSRPVNAGCSFIETSQIKNKRDYTIIRDNGELSLPEFRDPFWRPLGDGAQGKWPPRHAPRYATARTHSARVHDDEVIQKCLFVCLFIV
jgi:hypothetical protein